MKKIVAILLLISMLAALTACGKSSEVTEETSVKNQTSKEQTESGSAEDALAAKNTAEGTSSKKVLVVYYSATGTTKGIAEMIADSTGGDLFEIQPKEPYTDDDLDYNDANSRVSREHENEGERDVELVSTTVDNWDSYDTVFIGYPIWWGIAAWPVDNFVKDNDFTGKTVIPFCTSASSGIGDSGSLLEEMAGTGDWVEGRRLNRGVLDNDILEWTDELGIYNN